MSAGQAFDFERDGVCLLPQVVPQKDLGDLCDRVADIVGARGGARGAGMAPEVRALIGPDGPLTAIACKLCGEEVRATRVLVFDKSADRNWGLGWHQDRAIAVKARVDMPGFRHWTVKQGVPHVEAPEDVLSRMLTLRLHLDDCGPDNDPLEAALGSFRLGAISKQTIAERVGAMACAPCPAAAGDVLAMKGMTVHRSKPAKNPTHRRVLHVDYATGDLPGALEWAQA